MKLRNKNLLAGISLFVFVACGSGLLFKVAIDESREWKKEMFARLPIKVGDSIEDAYHIFGEPLRVWGIGSIPKMEGLTSSDRKALNYCVFFIYKDDYCDGGIYVFVDENEKIEYICFGCT